MKDWLKGSLPNWFTVLLIGALGFMLTRYVSAHDNQLREIQVILNDRTPRIMLLEKQNEMMYAALQDMKKTNMGILEEIIQLRIAMSKRELLRPPAYK